jgi:hypothetical protein
MLRYCSMWLSVIGQTMPPKPGRCHGICVAAAKARYSDLQGRFRWSLNLHQVDGSRIGNREALSRCPRRRGVAVVLVGAFGGNPGAGGGSAQTAPCWSCWWRLRLVLTILPGWVRSLPLVSQSRLRVLLSRGGGNELPRCRLLVPARDRVSRAGHLSTPLPAAPDAASPVAGPARKSGVSPRSGVRRGACDPPLSLPQDAVTAAPRCDFGGTAAECGRVPPSTPSPRHV